MAIVILLLGLLVVINGYRYLFYWWLLMHISDYFINSYGGYIINGH